MSLLSKMWNLVPKLGQDYEEKSLRLTPTWQTGRVAELPVDYMTLADQGFSKNEIVFACISRISSSACEPEYKAYVGEGVDAKEADYNHPLSILLREPNETMSFYDLIEMTMIMQLIGGNAFWEKERNGAGVVEKLWPMRPDRVKIIMGPNGPKAYEYRVGDYVQTLPATDVLHLKYYDPRSDWYGLAPLVVCAREADADNERIDFIRAFFKNAAVPYGLLTTKVKMEEAESARIRRKWKKQYSGIQNWHNIAVLDVDAQYQQLGLSQTDMAFPDLTRMSEARICMAFGVAPILISAYVGLDASTYSNYSQARRAFWEDKMAPTLRKLTETLTMGLGKDFNAKVRADVSHVRALEEDRTDLFARTTDAVQAGYVTVNEARKEVGLPTMPEQDVFIRPFNVSTFTTENENLTPMNPFGAPMGGGGGQPGQGRPQQPNKPKPIRPKPAQREGQGRREPVRPPKSAIRDQFRALQATFGTKIDEIDNFGACEPYFDLTRLALALEWPLKRYMEEIEEILGEKGEND